MRAGQIALDALDTHGYPLPLAEGVLERLRDKLRRDPVEDFRIDFEDGYGARTDAEEDGHARAAGAIVASGVDLPRRIGLRIRAFAPDTENRARRTLDLFLNAAAGRLPADLVVTLPKITSPEHVSALAKALQGTPLRIELMIETPQAMREIQSLVYAAEGRCCGVHFGAYDYLSACGVPFPSQSLRHPMCDFARSTILMQVSDLGIPVCDGVTNLIPAGGQETVRTAWKAHGADVRHTLLAGVYQGWDIHPAQLVSRYATLFQFYAEHSRTAATRLKNFVERERQATRIGAQFDDAATVSGLRNFFVRAIGCGAMTPALAKEMTCEDF